MEKIFTSVLYHTFKREVLGAETVKFVGVKLLQTYQRSKGKMLLFSSLQKTVRVVLVDARASSSAAKLRKEMLCDNGLEQEQEKRPEKGGCVGEARSHKKTSYFFLCPSAN